MKRYLTINPDTFLWIEGQYGLLYDSCRFSSYKFRLTSQISQLCNKLQDPDNLYSVEIYLDNIDDDLIAFIEHVTEKGMGRIHDNLWKRHLISFPPLLNIQHSWERIKARGNEAHIETLPYLTSLTFYTGGSCPIQTIISKLHILYVRTRLCYLTRFLDSSPTLTHHISQTSA